MICFIDDILDKLYKGDIDAQFCEVCYNLKILNPSRPSYRCSIKCISGVSPYWGYMGCKDFIADPNYDFKLKNLKNVLDVGRTI